MPSMVVLVLHDLSGFQDLMTVWRERGAPAVTILECMGTREPSEQASRRELPIMPRLRDVLYAEDMPRTTVFTVVEDEDVDGILAAAEEVLGDFSEAGRGILFVVPVTTARGLRRAARADGS